MKKVIILQQKHGDIEQVFTTKKAFKYFAQQKGWGGADVKSLLEGEEFEGRVMTLLEAFQAPQVEREEKPTRKDFIEYKGLEDEFIEFKERG